MPFQFPVTPCRTQIPDVQRMLYPDVRLMLVDAGISFGRFQRVDKLLQCQTERDHFGLQPLPLLECAVKIRRVGKMALLKNLHRHGFKPLTRWIPSSPRDDFFISYGLRGVNIKIFRTVQKNELFIRELGHKYLRCFRGCSPAGSCRYRSCMPIPSTRRSAPAN